MKQQIPLTLIVGMHRSGTSLLGSILPASGIAMPGKLIKGDSNNPEGYFEREDVTEIQEKLLINLERWWPSARGMRSLPDNWLEDVSTLEARANLKKILSTEQAQKSGPWAIKDPRASLFIPLWQNLCKELNIPLKLLLAVRNPKEVAMSLVARDQSYTGMDEWRAQQLWWHHNAQVLKYSDQTPLQVVSYDHWFNPEAAERQLLQLTPNANKTQRLKALAAIKPKHRHSHRLEPQNPMHHSVAALFDQLHAAALQPEQLAETKKWLAAADTPPGQPPIYSKRMRLGQNLAKAYRNLIKQHPNEHPWAYFAAMKAGSDQAKVKQQINTWRSKGFSEPDLHHAKSLPKHIPVHTMPKKEHKKAVVNNSDLSTDTKSAQHWLRLAKEEFVLDENRDRVGLLRQLGVNAFWLEH